MKISLNSIIVKKIPIKTEKISRNLREQKDKEDDDRARVEAEPVPRLGWDAGYKGRISSVDTGETGVVGATLSGLGFFKDSIQVFVSFLKSMICIVPVDALKV
jgi:hypothetical protein